MSLGVVLIVSALVAAAASFLLTPATIAVAKRVGALDVPSSRKIHVDLIPRLGGLAVIAASVIGLLAAARLNPREPHHLETVSFWFAVTLGLLPVVAVSIYDDIRSLGALPKFVAQVTGAAIAVALGVRIAPEIHLFGATISIEWLAVPLSILWIAGVTNAFNLVDGLDGLSAGLALISAISLGAVSVVAQKNEMALASFIVAGALFGFMPYNIYPAKVFLGDTGATSIGFTLGCLALAGGSTLSAGMAVLVPIIVLGLPIVETLVSMARRYLRKVERSAAGGVFEADREHFHHRLLSLGLTQKQAVLVLYGAGLIGAAGAVASLFMTYRNSAILLVGMIAAAFVGVHKLGYDEFAFVRRGTLLKPYEVPVLRSTLFAGLIDVVLVTCALYLAFVLKYDDLLVSSNRVLLRQMLPVVVGCFMVSLAAFRVYRGSWRLATVDDLIKPTLAVIVAGAASHVIASSVIQIEIPISLHIIFVILALGLLDGLRASYKVLVQWNRRAASEGEPILIYGAGVGGTTALREMLSNPSIGMRPIGFIDDDPHLSGRIVNGFPIVASCDTLVDALERHKPAGIVIASDKIPTARVMQVRDLCSRTGRWMSRFRIDMTAQVIAGSPDLAGIPVPLRPDVKAPAPPKRAVGASVDV